MLETKNRTALTHRLHVCNAYIILRDAVGNRVFGAFSISFISLWVIYLCVMPIGISVAGTTAPPFFAKTHLRST